MENDELERIFFRTWEYNFKYRKSEITFKCMKEALNK